jgi:hypothetical protein
VRLSVDICAGGVVVAAAEMRLRFVLTRFAPSVVRAALRAVACGPGRVRLHGEVQLVGGAAVSLTAEDEPSEAAMLHFIDRLGRTVARRAAGAGGARA